MGSPEAARKRILPIWMTQKGVDPAQQTETKSKRRKKAALARSETVYCMNEAELVDIALCILAENCKGKGAEVTSSEDEVQEPQHMLSDHHSSSVSDINISGTGSTPPKVLDALSSSENTKSEDDDDALKYVREIFFT
ncbi:cell cycle regulator of non-homologous end joining [Varanus komodoensis]|uniref:cell cycle regulator of non-homologous end joining n=1 Tax=Varanus komodoensis TaxID=61221 RepID=UPI001CF7CA16|nr:cell cycle regulator of non-homologous end joining [Varanus komodoensis]